MTHRPPLLSQMSQPFTSASTNAARYRHACVPNHKGNAPHPENLRQLVPSPSSCPPPPSPPTGRHWPWNSTIERHAGPPRRPTEPPANNGTGAVPPRLAGRWSCATAVPPGFRRSLMFPSLCLRSAPPSRGGGGAQARYVVGWCPRRRRRRRRWSRREPAVWVCGARWQRGAHGGSELAPVCAWSGWNNAGWWGLTPFGGAQQQGPSPACADWGRLTWWFRPDSGTPHHKWHIWHWVTSQWQPSDIVVRF